MLPLLFLTMHWLAMMLVHLNMIEPTLVRESIETIAKIRTNAVTSGQELKRSGMIQLCPPLATGILQRLSLLATTARSDPVKL